MTRLLSKLLKGIGWLAAAAVALVILLVASAALVLWLRDQQPSTHFLALDTDDNLELSLDEWRAYYGFCPRGTPPSAPWRYPAPRGWEGYQKEFSCMDLDHDTQVQWSEYRDTRMKLRSGCPPPARATADDNAEGSYVSAQSDSSSDPCWPPPYDVAPDGNIRDD
jgi:hypothetical protein